MKEQLPDPIYSPCCTWWRAFVQSENLALIERAAKSAKAIYGWKYTLKAFPPYWQLYLDVASLTKEELEQVKQGEGPSQVIRQMMEQ